MTTLSTAIWVQISFFAHLMGAVSCAAAALWVLQRCDPRRVDRGPILLALVLTGIWSAITAAFGPSSPYSELAETVRNMGWIWLLFRLFATDGRDESLRLIRPVVAVLALVELLHPLLLLVEARSVITPELKALTLQISNLLRMLVAVGALVLLHNLYAGAANASRQLLRWSALALVLAWSYELNLYTVAYLSGEIPSTLISLRGAVDMVLALILAVGASPVTSGLQFSPSHAVAFRSLSLLLIGGYLIVMAIITRSLSLLGGDLGRLTQIGFLVMAITAAIIWLPSPRLRGWVRVTAVKHLFQHRYDYREEWLRFTRTIGRGTAAEQDLHERAIKALADITDSPAGLLLAPNEEAQLALVARWRWSSIEVPAQAADYALAGLLEQQNFILDLDQVRSGIDHHGEVALVPEWLRNDDQAWALVPLLHFDRLVGAVVLSRPPVSRKLDWEDLDMLRVVGQQLASYLAEQSGQQALMEASRFDEFNRRMAFVMHDIKNLASQLSLLARNAEKHSENPDFRADMLVTLRNSSDKLNALLARLGRYGSGQIHARQQVDLEQLVKHLVDRFRPVHTVSLTRSEPCLVMADQDALEQALIHIVQNAIDASDDDAPVMIDLVADGINARVEIVDNGAGMSLAFQRNGLFKPFVSSKEGGFGIGAYESRELIRAMGGRLDVESREGLGSRFTIILPLAEAAVLLNADRRKTTEVA